MAEIISGDVSRKCEIKEVSTKDHIITILLKNEEDFKVVTAFTGEGKVRDKDLAIQYCIPNLAEFQSEEPLELTYKWKAV